MQDRGDVPGQQVVDAVDRIFGDPLENVAKVGFRFDFVQLCDADEL